VDVSSFAFETGGRRARLVIAQDVTERRRAEQRIRESEERYRGLVELSPDAILLVSRLSIVFANPAAIRFLGAKSESEIIGRPVTDFVAESEQDSLNARVHVAENGIPFSTIEQKLIRLDGRGVDSELAGSGFTFEGRPAVQLVARDLTERKATEARFRLLFERNLAGVYRSNTAGRVIECNEACARIFGFDSPAEMMKESAVALYDDPADRAQVLTLLQGEGSLQNLELRMRRKDGSLLWVLENMNLVPGEPGQPEILEGTIIDITARKLAQEQLEYQAYHDILTGLPNRLLFTDRIGVALAHARRKERFAAVMFLDLDQFKTINDTLGHSVGDRLLQSVASRLSTCVRAEDTVARMGGDEFTILLPDLADRQGAIKVADKVLEAVRYPLSIDGMELYISTSIGISMFPEDGADAEALLKSADAAMYRAKDSGRNNYKFF
jgi:diguanylate cyclase (GGDEF)-like protein/PAS domain S-box-containing protein